MRERFTHKRPWSVILKPDSRGEESSSDLVGWSLHWPADHLWFFRGEITTGSTTDNRKHTEQVQATGVLPWIRNQTRNSEGDNNWIPVSCWRQLQNRLPISTRNPIDIHSNDFWYSQQSGKIKSITPPTLSRPFRKIYCTVFASPTRHAAHCLLLLKCWMRLR